MTMHKLYWRISATAMLAGGLGACGSSNNGDILHFEGLRAGAFAIDKLRVGLD